MPGRAIALLLRDSVIVTRHVALFEAHAGPMHKALSIYHPILTTNQADESLMHAACVELCFLPEGGCVTASFWQTYVR